MPAREFLSSNRGLIHVLETFFALFVPFFVLSQNIFGGSSVLQNCCPNHSIHSTKSLIPPKMFHTIFDVNLPVLLKLLPGGFS